jgi:hypothetical protein
MSERVSRHAAVKPCEQQTDALRKAIDEWVKASEATRDYLVTMRQDPSEDFEPLPPGFFAEMQKAHERERRARQRCVEANDALYECMEKHKLID